MKIEVKQANFAKALNQVGRIVSNRTTLPVLGNVLLEAKEGKLSISATNLEVAITTAVMGKVEKEGVVTIPARLLSDFVLNNNDENIEISLKDLTLSLKSKKYSANIKGINSEEFPTVPTMPKAKYISIGASKFSDALRKVTLAAANDETRPVLAGVYMKFAGSKLVLAATDSYRLAEKKIDIVNTNEEKEIIVPSRTLNEVLRIASSYDGESEVEITLDENQVFFVLGEIQIVSRLIEGSFPNYEQIIPKNSTISSVSNLSETLSAIKMSALFAKDMANNIKVSVSKTGLKVRSAQEQIGDTESKVKAKTAGGEVEVAFNARYLIDVLGVLNGTDVKMEFNDDSSPGVVTSDKDKDYIYLVMPLKTDS